MTQLPYWTEFLTVTDHGDTLYRVSPNKVVGCPDYTAGASIEYSEDGGKTWRGEFSVAPESMRAIAGALSAAADELDRSKR